MCNSNVKSKHVATRALEHISNSHQRVFVQFPSNPKRTLRERENTRREKKRMPKSKKALLKPQHPPFLIRVLLLLAAMGVNINRPPPMKKLVAGASAFSLLVFFFLFRPNVLNIITPLTKSSERPDRSTVRCARTFPAVASHQLLTGDPMVKSGGLEAMDYLRDGFGVTNFDIGTPRADAYMRFVVLFFVFFIFMFFFFSDIVWFGFSSFLF